MKIIVIGTLDTKGIEVAFMAGRLAALGQTPVVIDPGTLGQPAIAAGVDRERVALAGGAALSDLLATHDKARIQAVMTDGLVRIVSEMAARGEVDGIVAVGGAQGTTMATAAMRALPVGIPKVMVSTIACGKTAFGPYVGTRDVTMIHSVADILGLNRVTRRVLAQACAAVAAMAAVPPEPAGTRPLVAITQAGITTPGVMAVKERLEALGCEVMAFHCNGIGGKAMEELVDEGVVSAVIDFSPHDVTDLLYGGLMPALPGRMEAAGRAGIPQIVVPGCTDIRLHAVDEVLPAGVAARPTVHHSPIHLHIRTTPEEMAAVAHFIAEKLNSGRGPRASVIPLRGYSHLNRRGEVLYDDQANLAYAETMRRELAPDVCQVEVDAHINEPAFADAVVETYLRLRDGENQPIDEHKETA